MCTTEARCPCPPEFPTQSHLSKRTQVFALYADEAGGPRLPARRPPIDVTRRGQLLLNTSLAMQGPTENRKAQRFSCRGPISFRVQNWSRIPGRILNLCLDGCLIEPSRSTDCLVGDHLDLCFKVNHISFRVQCVVRRVSPRGALGVEILLLSDRGRKQLTELIAELESLEYPAHPNS